MATHEFSEYSRVGTFPSNGGHLRCPAKFLEISSLQYQQGFSDVPLNATGPLPRFLAKFEGGQTKWLLAIGFRF